MPNLSYAILELNSTGLSNYITNMLRELMPYALLYSSVLRRLQKQKDDEDKS